MEGSAMKRGIRKLTAAVAAAALILTAFSAHTVFCGETSTEIVSSQEEQKKAEEGIRREIVDSRRRLEEMTGAEVTVFCWRGGDDYRRSAFSHSYLKEAGYRYLVSNLKIEKIA